MSALGGKADINHGMAKGPLLANSGQGFMDEGPYQPLRISHCADILQ